uniref:Uncharacterized protein n=1 Tax=uncultured marine virus TaxID=186617 RepID=A0A0F7L218_9VIRU|nr:hypothetical protein [uncultured marine virus]
MLANGAEQPRRLDVLSAPDSAEGLVLCDERIAYLCDEARAQFEVIHGLCSSYIYRGNEPGHLAGLSRKYLFCLEDRMFCLEDRM